MAYWGISLDDWRNFSIIAQGLLMLFLVATGVYQLLAIRAQAKRAATLEMCTRYASDALLCGYLREIHEARLNGDLEQNPLKYRPLLIPVLNFLDMVAIGVKRGIYDRKLTREYLRWIIRQNVNLYLSGDFPKKANIPLSGFYDLIELDRLWGDPTTQLPEHEKHAIFNAGKKQA